MYICVCVGVCNKIICRMHGATIKIGMYYFCEKKKSAALYVNLASPNTYPFMRI